MLKATQLHDFPKFRFWISYYLRKCFLQLNLLYYDKYVLGITKTCIDFITGFNLILFRVPFLKHDFGNFFSYNRELMEGSPRKIKKYNSE